MKINFNMNLINELTKADPKSLIERTLKLSEENGEVSEAVLSYGKVNGSQYKNKKIEDVEEWDAVTVENEKCNNGSIVNNFSN